MRWTKLGLVFDPRGRSTWIHSHALQPTPLLVEDERIRVYVGFRDKQGVSRVGYVEVDGHDPTQVIEFSNEPVLDIGLPGAFDDNGVVPSAVVPTGKDIRLYYAGYQMHQKVRFTVFGGLAISGAGKTFERFKRVPVMDRTNGELLFRVPHTVMRDGAVWRVWYGGGSRFASSHAKTLPLYDIRYVESEDGVHFPDAGRTVLATGPDEYRLGRPYVVKRAKGFSMFFGASKFHTPYVLGYAESDDGIVWTRHDDALNLPLSPAGFDSEMIAYPSVIRCEDRSYMFYNGNGFGEAGFGVAVLVDGDQASV
jgi:predicted GH43/DUF377 family glycosyl hydrolase